MGIGRERQREVLSSFGIEKTFGDEFGEDFLKQLMIIAFCHAILFCLLSYVFRRSRRLIARLNGDCGNPVIALT